MAPRTARSRPWPTLPISYGPLEPGPPCETSSAASARSTSPVTAWSATIGCRRARAIWMKYAAQARTSPARTVDGSASIVSGATGGTKPATFRTGPLALK